MRIWAVGMGSMAALSAVDQAFVARRPSALLAAGVLFVLAFVSPLAAARPYLFAIDMLQHIALTLFVAPLLIYSRLAIPGFVPRLPRAFPFCRWLRDPRMSLAVYLTVVYLSLLPAVYEVALRAEPLHLAMHVALFGVGLLFWQPIIGVRRGQLRAGWALLYLGAAVFAQAKFLPGLLILLDRPLYTYYAEVPRVWGLAVLDDQQFGAAVLGFGSVIPLAFVMCAIAFKWLRQQDRQQAAREAREDGILISPLQGRLP